MMADQGNFVAVEMRNRMFSCINDYVTTTSSSQVGQGATDVLHIAAWDVPLEPRDSRWPPAELKPPFWDPKPIQMMSNAQLQAAMAELGESVSSRTYPESHAEATGAQANAKTGNHSRSVIIYRCDAQSESSTRANRT